MIASRSAFPIILLTCAVALAAAKLPRLGYLKASTIIDLELVLREMGESPTFRDPELYYFIVFGTPSRTVPWGCRAEGHHLSLNFTLLQDTLIATSPTFFGANPAVVRINGDFGRDLLRDHYRRAGPSHGH